MGILISKCDPQHSSILSQAVTVLNISEINMPDKSLHRLESYQSGGSICGGDGGGGNDPDDIGVSVNDVDANLDTAGSRRPPSLLAQFSLIGEVDDEEEAMMETGSPLLLGSVQRRRWRNWCMRYYWRLSAIAFSIGLLIFIFPTLSGTNNADTDNSASASTTSSSDEHMSCPIQSSYFVSSEIMELKNSSTVENVQNGAVATDHQICSQIGVSILQIGGNAADAAIASAMCLGVVNPSSSGIGGGAFILVHSDDNDQVNDSSNDHGNQESTTPPFEDARTSSKDASYSSEKVKVTEFIDCRETAPHNSTYDMYELNPESSMLGGLAIATPGELRGLDLLHHRHGSLPWETLVRPAMELARDGFVVEAFLAKAIRSKEEIIRKMPNLLFLLTKNNDGATLLREGDVMIRSQYAKTLEAIMQGGADALYQGDMAKMLAKDIQDAGGIVTSTDISSYNPFLRDPLISRVAGYNLVGAPPPSSGGGAIIGALRFLSGFAPPYSALVDTLSKHWYVEACRHVFAIRMSLSDPSFAPEVNTNAVKDLIEGEYIESLRKLTLDNSVLNLSQYGGPNWAQLKDHEGKGSLVDAQEGDRRRRRAKTKVSRNMRLFNYLEDHGTTSLSVVDKNRNTVTITSSVNLQFGSKVVSPSTGIVLNNQMDDFSSPGRVNYFGLHPSESNYVAPGKRALSSMAPTLVFRDINPPNGQIKTDDGSNNLGKLVLSLGGSGGPKIITSVLQTILNNLFLGVPLYESVSAPRIHNQLLYHGAAGTNIEQDTLPQGPLLHLSERTRIALEKRGHRVIGTDFLGTVQAVVVDLETDSLTAVADIRKQGMPAGY